MFNPLFRGKVSLSAPVGSALTSPLTRSPWEPRRWISKPLRKVVAVLAVVLAMTAAALPAAAPPALVQHASKDAGTTLSSSLAFPSNNVAGNWIGVVIRAGHSAQSFTISDTQGNSYHQAVLFNQTLDTPNGDTLGIFYSENIAGGANTVTVSVSISNNTLRFSILEYSGLATSSSLDMTATAEAQGSGASANSGSGTTTAAGDLVLGAVLNGSGVTCTAGSGYTIEDRVPAAPNTKLIVEDQIQGIAGGVSASATFSASASWGAAVAAFKAAGGGGGAPPSITNLSPFSGPVGTSVTITGTNFATPQGSSTVTFGGVSAGVASSWSPTSITAFVPAGATSGNVVVRVGGVASNGLIFTVLTPPSITSVTPASGPVGGPVTIVGANFGATLGTVTFNGVAVTQGISWTPTSISVSVPAGASTGNVLVTAGGLTSNGVTFTVTVVPVITVLNPASGALGTLVSMSGAGFGATQGSSTVSFSGTSAAPTFWSQALIMAPVPAGATAGNVVITVGGQASNGVNFTVTAISVGVAPPTATVPIGTTASFLATVQNDVQNKSVTWSVSGIGCSGAACGTVASATGPAQGIYTAPSTLLNPPTVLLTATSMADPTKSGSATITVTSSAPSITSMIPMAGPVGTPVTIGGTNFGGSQGNSTIAFNGTIATPTSWSATVITAPVPTRATTGSVAVTVAGIPSNPATFVVTPTIASLSPASGPRGSSVTITGTNFGATLGASVVTFNGVPGTPTSWSETRVIVPVPVGATSGNVVVTVGGFASNGVAFAVTTALVQHASKDAGATSSSSLAFPVGNTSGNWIGVVIRAGHAGQIFTLSDTRGNTYRQAVLFNQTLDTPNGDTLAIFYAENIAGGANTVTVADSISNNTVRFAVLEYSGLAASNSLDVTAAAQGIGTLASSGNAATTAAGDLVLGGLMTGSGVTYSPGSGFVIEERIPAAPNTKLIAEDLNQAAAGVVAATATLSASASWGSTVAAFKSASGVAGLPPNIASLIPASGPAGTSVTIAGTNFGASQGNSTVTFNGIVVTPGSWSTTGISVLAPTALATGNATVIVTVNNIASNGATFTVTAPPPVSVTVSPLRGGVTLTQPMSLTAAVQNDSSNAGVSWSSSGGTLNGPTSSVATFSATAAGVYTITATSKADITKSVSAVIGVTDLSSVGTWRNDTSRSGVNSREYALTPQNVTTGTFAKLFSCPVDGQVFAQPLWVSNLSIGGTQHNVVFVATENDSLYAFDADGPTCKPVWSTASVRLIPSGEVVVPFADLQNDNALGPVVGITGTPVIDPSSQTIYLVALTEVSATSNVVQRLHAIDITTGHERAGSPQIISASITGASGYDNSGGTITFSPSFQKQRPALLLLNGIVYVSWAGFLDTDFYHGWLVGYDATTLSQVAVFNDTPDGGRGGIWMSGGGPAADSQGNIYLLTGNGDFNANSPGGRNYGDTFVKLGTAGGLSVADWFTPHDQGNMASNDLDLGGGGAVLLLDQSTGPLQHLVLGGSKGGKLYVVNRDSLGGYNATSDTQIVQSFLLGSNGIYSAPLFWQNTLYAAGSGSTLGAYPFSPANDQFQVSPSVVSNQIFSHPGTTPSLSAAGTSNAILWAIRRPSATAPAVLHAFDPNNIHTGLWDSSQASGNRDQAGVAVKFTVPTVANGKVYIGTMTELDVYALLPN